MLKKKNKVSFVFFIISLYSIIGVVLGYLFAEYLL
ncbi:hypothetical protein [Acinetobacter sp. ANC 4648]|nr:hypothetical protein [Acinetobacter sp. ANC 4648]